jgi:hypothetical protein
MKYQLPTQAFHLRLQHACVYIYIYIYIYIITLNGEEKKTKKSK